MKISFANPSKPKSGAVVVGVFDGRKLSTSAASLDKSTRGAITKAIKASSFKGAKNHSLTIMTPAGTRLERVLCVGLGKPKDLDERAFETIGGRIYAALKAQSEKAQVLLDAAPGCGLSADEMAVHVGIGARLGSYRFDKYKTKKKGHAKPVIKEITIQCAGSAAAKRNFTKQNKVIDGVFFTRDLISEPSNVLYPKTLAGEAKTLAKLGVKIEVLDKAKMTKLGMGALLGVAQGSAHDPFMVVMRWDGATKKDKPVAFVGKGVTFDTGGISLKPSAGMEDMKYDMGGSGVVIGLMKALAGRKAKVNAVGVVGLVENMPSGTAQRPGDIVKSMSGQTIEVLNTDAEGRLVLADALWYTKERFKPQLMIDLATLTGAIVVSLAGEYAGLFSNDDKLAVDLEEAGKAMDEKLWRLPMGDAFDKMIDSPAADMQNISSSRGGGSITAAQFLKRFVGNTKWAHLDIAGVTWEKKGKPTTPKGGSGYGVRLLDRFVADRFEK